MWHIVTALHSLSLNAMTSQNLIMRSSGWKTNDCGRQFTWFFCKLLTFSERVEQVTFFLWVLYSSLQLKYRTLNTDTDNVDEYELIFMETHAKGGVCVNLRAIPCVCHSSLIQVDPTSKRFSRCKTRSLPTKVTRTRTKWGNVLKIVLKFNRFIFFIK